MSAAKPTAGSPASARGRAAPVPAPAADAEWLLTDGAGGYACGTVADLPTRRYHGLWVARPAGTTRRHQVVAGLDERLVAPMGETSLLHAHWASLPGPVAPRAEVAFAHRPLPRWTFTVGDRVVERTIALARVPAAEAPMLLIRWANRGPEPVVLRVRPLIGWCDADHLPVANDAFDGAVQARGASWGFRPTPALPLLWLSVDGVAAFRGDPVWYRGFLFATDRDRGYDHVGDRWSPGVLELDVPPGASAIAAFRFEQPCDDPRGAFDVAHDAADDVVRRTAPLEPLRAHLERGADDFLYRAPGDRLGVLAGFPWFGEWGRDVFVALPGLLLARDRVDECAAVLSGAVPFVRRGLLPNVYGRSIADSHYDSCDAALWFALAVARWADGGGDAERLRDEYVPVLRRIADAYFAGTDLGMGVDASGLLAAGRGDLNATWMDARLHSGPVTPRDGLPVEIQALWYSLLAFLVQHGETRFAGPRDRCGDAFVRRFWLEAEERLADRVHDGLPDRTVRPNMVIAAALPLSPLSRVQRAGVVRAAREDLVTPRGLRTLSPRDPSYRGRYEGGVEARDGAYHQGTAWPWLAGFHVEASLRAATARQLPKVRAELRAWLDDFLPECSRAGLDHVSEVFDGDPPQRPGGTFAQAWNTGELLRALRLLDPPVAGANGRRA